MLTKIWEFVILTSTNVYSPVGFVDLGLEELILIAVSIVKDDVVDDDPKTQNFNLREYCQKIINLNNF